MRILIIGKQNHLHWVENVYDAFKKLSYNVNYLFTNKQGNFNDFNRNFLKIFNKNLSKNYSLNCLNKKILEFSPDIIFVVSPFMYDIKFTEMIESIDSCLKIGWVGDIFSSEHKAISDKYDKLYFTDSYFLEMAEMFKFKNYSYLPLAANSNIFYDKKLIRNDNLLFIGNPTKERIDLFFNINKDVKLIGSKWKNINLKNNIEIVKKDISIYEVAEEYNKSNFVLNLKHSLNVINGLNMRTFEVPACGACLIQDYVKDLELNFDLDKEVVTYNNVEELTDLYEKLRKEKKLTKQIIEHSSLNVHSNHLYTNRINKIIKDIT